jgi:hypothetical protein
MLHFTSVTLTKAGGFNFVHLPSGGLVIGLRVSTAHNRLQVLIGLNGRGRDEDFSSPPAQIPACAANAPGSSLGSDVV